MALMKLALAGVFVFAALMLPFKIMGSPLTPEQQERARQKADEIVKHLHHGHGHVDVNEIAKRAAEDAARR
jgi:hypothetical protein